jgi:hypothetical protein
MRAMANQFARPTFIKDSDYQTKNKHNINMRKTGTILSTLTQF